MAGATLASTAWTNLAFSPGSTGSTRSTGRARRPASCSRSCAACSARPSEHGTRPGVVGDRRRGGGGRAPRTAPARDIIGACSPTGTRSRAAARKPATRWPLDRSRLGRRDEDGRRQPDPASIRASGRLRSTARPAEEEIFYVLGGTGVCLLDGAAFEVGPGDCIVHRPRELHALRAGDDGLDVLAFGSARTHGGCAPASGRVCPGSVAAGSKPAAGAHPWAREAAAGEPELPELGRAPRDGRQCRRRRRRRLARAAAGGRSPATPARICAGLNWGRLNPGRGGCAAASATRPTRSSSSCSTARGCSSSGRRRSASVPGSSTRR